MTSKRRVPVKASGAPAGLRPDTTMLRAAMDTMLDPMVMMEPVRDESGLIVDFTIVDGNEAFFRFVNHARDDYLGTRLLTTVPGQAESGLLAAYSQAYDGDEPFRAIEVPYADELFGGDVRLYDLHGRRALDRLVLTFRDVTDRVKESKQLEYLAYHDPLTDLHNVAWARRQLDRELRLAHATGGTVAVFFLGMDNFKLVNDSLGHTTGDEMLRTVAGRFAESLPDGTSCGRFGSDEFLVIAPGVSDDEAVAAMANTLQRAVSQETSVAGHVMVPSVTIGVALSDADSDASSLLRDADSALARAKTTSRGSWRRFDGEMFSESVRRLTVEAELHQALTRDEFVVYYQPIVELAGGRVIGHEALVRWQHPVHGLLGPFAFLPVAEESGLIIGIGHRVLTIVCEDLEAGRLPGTVSVNVSAVELVSPHWLEGFRSTLAMHHVAPNRIIVEVTETSVLNALDAVSGDLRQLRQLGIGIHLDDFGTGFSSIALLRDLPVTGLKLDRRFVSDLTTGPADGFAHALADGVATLMNGLHLDGIAEGIETREQADALLRQGWTLGQGYFFGKPAPLAAHGPGSRG
jgi:diguanylate cyclase (GGDEF)-like protein